MKITTTLDPISLNDTHTHDYRLVLREQNLDICFESQANLDTYVGMHIERPGVDLMYNLDNPSDELGGDWN
jgi:hypothetical protein